MWHRSGLGEEGGVEVGVVFLMPASYDWWSVCAVPDMVRCGSESTPVGRFSEVQGVEEGGVVNVSMSWEPPENPRGFLVNYTLVLMSYSSGEEIARAVLPPNSTSHTFTQLTLGKG